MLFRIKHTTSLSSKNDASPASANNRNTYALKTKRLALSAILAAMAMILSYIEALIPVPVPVPGIKLGLANLIVIIAIYKLGFRYAFVINCVRIFTAGLLFTGVFGVIFNGGRNYEYNHYVCPLQNRTFQYGWYKHGRRSRS